MGCGGSKDEVNAQAQGKGKAAGGRKSTVKNQQGNKGGKGKVKEVREPVNEKGYKKRIREQLRQAATNSDIEELEHAIDLFEKNKLEDNGDYTDAIERLKFLYLRKELRDAILRRHPGILDKAIDRVEASEYVSELSQPLDTAKRLREHLTELDQYRHDILEMDQSTISEIRSYHHPPDGVHEVMMGTYMLLGYDEEKLRDWTDVQCLLGRYGKESLIREVRNADTININSKTSQRVLKMQSKFSLEQIRGVSNGAATFYVWNTNMANKSDKDRQQEQQPSQTPTPGKQSGKSTPAQKDNKQVKPNSNKAQPNAKDKNQPLPNAKDKNQQQPKAKDKNQPQPKAKDKTQANTNPRDKNQPQPKPNNPAPANAKDKNPAQPNSNPKDKNQSKPKAVDKSQPNADPKNKNPAQPNAKDKNQPQSKTADKNQPNANLKDNKNTPNAKDKNQPQPNTKDKNQPNANSKVKNATQPNPKDKNQQPKAVDKNQSNPNPKDKNPVQPDAKNKNQVTPKAPNANDNKPADAKKNSTKANDINQVQKNSKSQVNSNSQVQSNPQSNTSKPKADPQQSTTDRKKTKG